MFSTKYNETENLWYGLDTLPLYNPKINMAQALLNSMSTFGSKVAQVSWNRNRAIKFRVSNKIIL